MQKLFEKYLDDRCSPEEELIVMDYFRRDENAEDIKALIRREFEKEIPIEDKSARAVDDIYQSFDWIGEQKKAGPGIRYLFRPGVAATWALLLICLAASFYLFRRNESTASQTVASTAFGERKKIELADGTIVWLNAASKLTYPGKFTGERREVYLEGEAYFDVAEDAGRPFVIRSGELETTVLGTSFNIRAYEEDKKVSVAVVTGMVRVVSPDSELQLEPNQEVVFDKRLHKLNNKAAVSASEIAAWKEGLFQFRNTTFSEVTASLQRSHNVRIKYDPRLEDCPVVHADFKESDSLESILKTLMISVNGLLEETGDGEYYLKATFTCNP